ncbi:putative ferric-chelate reductase 1 isoform X2 [Pleuronectes platessa]|uniref:putative ferric-chelate reductase 1 isoform X2 n=1 Tax=Pleuronectes platessa TaxID=8262 RepID=UPI00232A1CF3|nr:putative ferric-chelate reductase 1 isoform X2 [Pleuronectes platessa]
MDSCKDMQPHHSGLSPQTEPAPFTITTDHSSYRLGEEVKVQLLALGSAPFIGFLLQAREVGGQSPVGSFELTPGAAQLLICNQRPNSAVSHRSDSIKTSILVTWRSEASRDGKPIQFHASFVQNYKTFWVDVTSLVLTFSDDGSGGSTSLPPPTITSSTTTSTIDLQHASPGMISSADCGINKMCFSQPSDCDPAVSVDCFFMSAMMSSPTDKTIRYEMTGPSNGYISFGFSDDQMMGNDDIYICCKGSDGQVGLQHAFSTGRTTPQAVPLGNVTDVTASAQDRVISCSFTSMNTVSTQRTKGFNKTYHLMFAHGPSSYGQIQLHVATFISTDKIDISRPQIVVKAGWSRVIKAHGALMLIAWMTTGSLGMMVARYVKGVTKGHNLWGKDVWFLGAHPVLGCLVMILSFLQPVMALMRCGQQHRLRFLFNWSHSLNAVVIKTLAVAAIFTGLKLIDSTLDHWLMKVMGGFVGWESLCYILLEVHLNCTVSNTDSLKSKKITVIPLMILFCLGNCAFLVALLVGIGMS